ncbi:MAG: hypothetical protein ACFCBU_10180 [Cyanophyceae cyanobacterium]
MFSSLSYRELQQALKAHRAAGIKTIALNSKKAALIAELERIETSLVEPPAATVAALPSPAPVVTTWSETAIAWFHRRVLPVLPRRIAIGFAFLAELRSLFGQLHEAMGRTDQALAGLQETSR